MLSAKGQNLWKSRSCSVGADPKYQPWLVVYVADLVTQGSLYMLGIHSTTDP